MAVEDSEDDALLIAETLRDAGRPVACTRVETADDMRAALSRENWDLITADFHMPGFTAMEALKIAQELGSGIPFLVVSGAIGEEDAVALMRRGAHDFFLKGSMGRFPAAVERELNEAENRRQRRLAEQKILRQAEQLASTNAELALKNTELGAKNEELAAMNRELKIRAQQLYRSNVDLERFAYVASHDLNEPLRSIASFSQMLGRYYEAGRLTPDTADEFIGYIKEGVERMKRLIEGLLTFSRATHDTDFDFSALDPAQVVEGVMSSLRQAIAETNAEILCEPLPVVTADATQLGQIFQNLVSNALKYHRKGVRPEVRISAERRSGAIVFAVQDNGIGIDPKHWERIFVIFKRLHTQHEIPGTGVGLALAKRLVERHGGRIWVESQPGVGSTFRFTIPAATSPSEIIEAWSQPQDISDVDAFGIKMTDV
ncbi:MAG: response regulator [Acidobacteriaceae bacterium]|nr:response regulator [Acidobacteriaceae bacterium]